MITTAAARQRLVSDAADIPVRHSGRVTKSDALYRTNKTPYTIMQCVMVLPRSPRDPTYPYREHWAAARAQTAYIRAEYGGHLKENHL